MGLDDFRTGVDRDDEDDTDETDEEEQETETETSSSSTTGGLESFRTSKTAGDDTEENDSETEDNSIFGVHPTKWRLLPKDEQIQYVRENHIPDYEPDYQIDSRWDYEWSVSLSCVCGNQFTFLSSGVCLDCGRRYKDVGRTVVKTQDPYQDKEEDNEPDDAN